MRDLLRGFTVLGFIAAPTLVLTAIGIGITATWGQTACSIYALSIAATMLIWVAYSIGKTL